MTSGLPRTVRRPDFFTNTLTWRRISHGGSPNNVVVGPDLNESRPPLDKKLYRQILLPNGLRAVLISDTLALQQPPYGKVHESDDDDESM